MAQAREGRLLWLVLIALCVSGGLLLLFGHQPRAERLVANEDAALALLRSLAEAQARHHEAEGRYAWLHELDAGSDLSGLRLVTTGKPPRAEATFAEAAGYRFDVLLPNQIQGGALVRVVPRGSVAADDELRAKHMVLVARPLDVGITGYRFFCTDESGFIWVSEGVSDEALRDASPLPDAHLSTSSKADTSGHVWHRLDKLVPRGAAEEVRD